jgi:hypothetical protein
MSWPSSCAGRPNVKAADKACQCSATTTTFEVPWDVTSVPAYAFANCRALTTIKGLEDITSFGKGAFSFSGLKSLIWPEGATEIPEAAFSGCDDFKFIHDGSLAHVTSIGPWAFSSSGLLAIEWPPAVTEVAPFTFASCLQLHSISGLDNVTHVGLQAFSYALNLRTVYLPKGCELGPGAFQGVDNEPVFGKHAFYGTHAIDPPSPSPTASPSAPPLPDGRDGKKAKKKKKKKSQPKAEL